MAMSVYVTASLLLFNLFGSCVVADGCRVVVEGVA